MTKTEINERNARACEHLKDVTENLEQEEKKGRRWKIFCAVTWVVILTVAAICLAAIIVGCAASSSFASKERRDWDYAVAAICQEKGFYFVADGKQTDRLFKAGKTPQEAFAEMRKTE